MNKVIEENFVNSYIIKNKRERLLFELWGKKRRDGIGRFSHWADNLIEVSKIRFKGQYISNDLREIVATTHTSKCYVISWYEELDGKEFN
ncbi:MAG: hypothetical protein IKU11_07615, partial [Clostridia bacterium]|nr:hypothetical protein [Clostridia bacterium]